ncbi:MAG: plastocyanin/azurin family copper-binding protein [Gammaproteobacteria bacterium]
MPRALIAAAMVLSLGACSKPAEPEKQAAAPAPAPAATVAPAKPETSPTPAASPVAEPVTSPVAAAETPPAAAATSEAAGAPPVQAGAEPSTGPENHVVKGVVTQWQPLLLMAQPGDSVTFTNMTGHDTESLEGMIPEGAEHWRSQLGEEGFTITLPVAGAYVYKCNPHITTGMVGIIIVGDPAAVDLDALNEAAAGVTVGRNMVQRAIRKARKALAAG